LLCWIAWRARRAGLQPVAWIQRPTPANLKRVGALSSYSALQVDDHFFARPPVAISSLKASLAPRQLWCSFQPGQYSWRAAQHCDHVDIQVYRQGCSPTVDSTYQLGVAGRRDTAIAVYHDGSAQRDRGDRQSAVCLQVEEPRALAHSDHPRPLADAVAAPLELSFRVYPARGCG